jgi:hypothetical protein
MKRTIRKATSVVAIILGEVLITTTLALTGACDLLPWSMNGEATVWAVATT